MPFVVGPDEPEVLNHTDLPSEADFNFNLCPRHHKQRPAVAPGAFNELPSAASSTINAHAPPLQVPAPSPSFLKCSPVITALLAGSRSSWAGDGLVRWHFQGYGQVSWDVPSRAGQVPWFLLLLEGKKGQRETSDSLGIRD